MVYQGRRASRCFVVCSSYRPMLMPSIRTTALSCVFALYQAVPLSVRFAAISAVQPWLGQRRYEHALVSDKRHGFPVESIVHTVWGYYPIPFPSASAWGRRCCWNAACRIRPVDSARPVSQLRYRPDRRRRQCNLGVRRPRRADRRRPDRARRAGCFGQADHVGQGALQVADRHVVILLYGRYFGRPLDRTFERFLEASDHRPILLRLAGRTGERYVQNEATRDFPTAGTSQLAAWQNQRATFSPTKTAREPQSSSR